jgi:hypothetical protein
LIKDLDDAQMKRSIKEAGTVITIGAGAIRIERTVKN